MRTRAAVVAVLAGAALAVPATPATAAACTQGSGVTVVVDFASLGGGTQTRCASGDPSSGLAALRGAGFTTTRAAQEAGYFVCRIDGKPADDPCQRTSPADAYWSYWHARPGGSWSYSSGGPADYDPAPGTVEGWAFGAGKPPSSPPPTAATSPTPAAATRASTSPSPRPSPRAMATTAAAVLARPTPTSQPSTAPPTPSTAPAAVAGVSPRAVAPLVVGRTRTLTFHRVPTGAVVAVLLVLGLGTAALIRAAARRRREGGG